MPAVPPLCGEKWDNPIPPRLLFVIVFITAVERKQSKELNLRQHDFRSILELSRKHVKVIVLTLTTRVYWFFCFSFLLFLEIASLPSGLIIQYCFLYFVQCLIHLLMCNADFLVSLPKVYNIPFEGTLLFLYQWFTVHQCFDKPFIFIDFYVRLYIIAGLRKFNESVAPVMFCVNWFLWIRLVLLLHVRTILQCYFLKVCVY